MRYKEIDFKNILLEVDVIEKSNTKTINIDNNSIFTYMFNTPTRTIEVDAETSNPNLRHRWLNTTELVDNNYEDIDETVYILPHRGDILLSIEISGVFSSVVELYQYNGSFSKKIIYDTSIGIDGIENKIIFNPFKKSGIPLLQLGRNFYVTIKKLKKPNNCKVFVTVAFLDNKSRKELARYHDPNNDELGVKIRHNNNNLYQVFGVHDITFSPNYLGIIPSPTTTTTTTTTPTTTTPVFVVGSDCAKQLLAKARQNQC
jgi:hypothetical protein